MPKTATGKIQRRLVAKAMIENEKKFAETKAKVSWDSSSDSLKGQKSQETEKPQKSFFVMLPKMIMGVFGKCLHRRK